MTGGWQGSVDGFRGGVEAVRRAHAAANKRVFGHLPSSRWVRVVGQAGVAPNAKATLTRPPNPDFDEDGLMEIDEFLFLLRTTGWEGVQTNDAQELVMEATDGKTRLDFTAFLDLMVSSLVGLADEKRGDRA